MSRGMGVVQRDCALLWFVTCASAIEATLLSALVYISSVCGGDCLRAKAVSS